tara:strand:- start:225 stop:431 length:207 start_codon:yes stop_codon:yes gene_type:complete
MKTKIQYYIAQADIAHDLYSKSKGSYESVWMGAAKGFKTQITDAALFAKCKEKAAEILVVAKDQTNNK